MAELQCEQLEDGNTYIWWFFASQERKWMVDLEQKGIATIADLKRATDAELLAIEGLGKKALAELRALQRGIDLNEEQG